MRRLAVRRTTRRIGVPPRILDPSTSDPDQLRDVVRGALLALDPQVREAASEELLAALAQRGVNLPTGRLLLGITALNYPEMTELDLAKLVRYVRINSPGVLAQMPALERLVAGTGVAQRDLKAA